MSESLAKKSMISATLKTALGQISVMFLGMCSMKILAIVSGPAGVGIFSLLRNAQQYLSTVATLGGSGNFVVQGIACWPDLERRRYISASFWVFFIATLSVCFSLLALPVDTFQTILADKHKEIIQLMAFPVAASSIMVFFRAVLNADFRFGDVAKVNVAVALGSLLFMPSIILTPQDFYHKAFVLILGASFSLGAFSAIYFIRLENGCPEVFLAITKYKPSSAAVIHLFRIAFPTLVTSFASVGSIFLVRAIVVKSIGVEAAGWFDAAWSIGSVYLVFFLTSLQTYLLPAVSSANNHLKLSHQVKVALRFMMISFVPVLAALIILKPLVIEILYSEKFLPSLEIMRWALIGDLFRAYSSILATVLIARADMRAFMIRELAWSSIFLTTAYLFLPQGVWGVGIAYLVAYVVYFVIQVWRICKVHGLLIDIRSFVEWCSGLCIILAVSILTWHDTTVIASRIPLIFIGLMYSLIIMTKGELLFLRSLPGACMRRIKKFKQPT